MIIGNFPQGADTSDATATASDIVSGITAYVDGVKIEGILPKVSKGQISLGGNASTTIGDYSKVVNGSGYLITYAGSNVTVFEVIITNGSRVKLGTIFVNGVLSLSVPQNYSKFTVWNTGSAALTVNYVICWSR